MRTHLACDPAGARGFLGAATLRRDAPARDPILRAALGLSELLLIAAGDRDVTRDPIDRAGRSVAARPGSPPPAPARVGE